MIVNGKDIQIDELLENNDFKKHLLKKVNDNISLTEHQINILKTHHINYEVASLKELIYLINDVLDEDDDEELENLLTEISERDYYENTKK